MANSQIAKVGSGNQLTKVGSDTSEKKDKPETEPLDPVIEVNEEIFDRPCEEGDFEEISPRIFTLKEVKEPLTIPSLNNAIYELGVVNLCWPEITEPVFETRTCFPVSYYTNSTKERLLLTYAENFRRQFGFNYKFRRPLLLQAPNECGLQKMVCTSIRPTKLCYAGTNTWQGIASLVADYFEYEPLSKPVLLPERLMSPYTAIVRRRANPFELAHLCVSWMAGAGYDAYVVAGCAKRDVCMAIRYRSICPDLPDENPKVEEAEEEGEEPRYRLVPLPDLTSKYIKEQDAKAAAKAQAELDKVEDERLRRIAELEQPPPDKVDRWRTHAWVLVLRGFMDVQEPFFVEPSEGVAHPTSAPQYQAIDCVYNHENYYANLQNCDKGLGNLNYDLADLTCWEHLLAGEPKYRRDIMGIDQDDPRTAVDTEKHLDMPASWVEKLDIIPNEYEQRYPGGHKVIHYKKVLMEKFAPYSERDGIVKRIKTFEDYALTLPVFTYEWYEHRVDLMEYVKIDHKNRFTYEKFGIGRKEHLIRHDYSFDAPSVSIEAVRTLEFNYYARLDHLTKLVCTPLTFDEYYTDREDRLESRLIEYTAVKDPHSKRLLKNITEQYGRNHAVPAVNDPWRKIFHAQDNTIELLFHYEFNFNTNNTRSYVKPNLAETGGRILYDPDKITEYIASPTAKLPRPLDVFVGLCDNLTCDDNARKKVRDRETDIYSYLVVRHTELVEPMLEVDLFDTGMNKEAQMNWTKEEDLKAEVSHREKEAVIDPLAPYLARFCGSGHGPEEPLSVKECILLREQCLNDYKAGILRRQKLVHASYVTVNDEYKNLRLWYLANQYILTPKKESDYFTESAELAFRVHNMEVRLSRAEELSKKRIRDILSHLDSHPMLAAYNRYRLENRLILYTPGTKTDPARQIKDITEEYSRNESVPAVNDVWRKMFHIQENSIELLNHYEYNFVTNNSRRYIKPNLAETGGVVLYYPDKTSGYIADPCARPPRAMDIYMDLCENMDLEYTTRKYLRDRQTDIVTYLRNRHKELTEPRLKVALFDTDRNHEARKGWKEQEAIRAEVSEREKEAEIDPLAPYLARMFGSGHGSGTPLSLKEATLVREQCVNDFKSKQLQRQILVQERFDTLNAEYKSNRLWYLANQYILTPEKEASYFANSAKLAFRVHNIEVRLTRHKDLSIPRFKVLMDYLDKHPLLKEFRGSRHHSSHQYFY